MSRMTWEQAVLSLKEQPDKKGLVRACYYDDPLAEAAERFTQSAEWAACRAILEGNLPGKVLDIGAGRGISSYAFAKAGCEVTALEPDPSLFLGAGAIRQLADEKKLPIEVVEEFGERLPFPDAVFNIVYGRAVLHHARDLNRLCEEIHRVLKPGGVFLGVREHVIRDGDLETFLRNHPLHHLYGGEHAFKLEEYHAAFEKAGFVVERTILPYESVINYFPETEDDVLRKALGGGMASVQPLVRLFPFLKKKLIAKLNGTGYYPGILYSFLIRKPR